jgi:hypothetical protein
MTYIRCAEIIRQALLEAVKSGRWDRKKSLQLDEIDEIMLRYREARAAERSEPWRSYEATKAVLMGMNLTGEVYQAAINAVASELGL